MIEKISNFFKEVKDRASNPLFTSFVISWLIINWKIPIGLLWYSYAQLKADGFTSYIGLVNSQYNLWYSLFLPLLIAIAYTAVIRNLIRGLSAWANTWGTKWVLNLAKEAKVPMAKYLELRDQYEKQTKLLDDLWEKESLIKRENETLKNTNSKIEREKDVLREDLDKWRSLNKPDILNGDWQVTHNSNNSKAKILTGSMIVFTNRGNESEEAYFLEHYFYNPGTNRVCIIWRNTKDEADRILDLLASEDLIFLSGIQIRFNADHGAIIGKKYDRVS